MTCLILLSRCSGQCTQRRGKRTPALTRYFPMATIQASKGGRPYGGGQPLNWRRITQRAANEHWRTAQGPPRGRLRSKLGLRTYFGGIFWPQVSDKSRPISLDAPNPAPWAELGREWGGRDRYSWGGRWTRREDSRRGQWGKWTPAREIWALYLGYGRQRSHDKSAPRLPDLQGNRAR